MPPTIPPFLWQFKWRDGHPSLLLPVLTIKPEEMTTTLQLSRNQLLSFLVDDVCSPLLYSGLLVTGVV